MKFEKLSIECESLENRKKVFEILDSMGYRGVGSNDDLLFVHAYDDGEYQTYYGHFDHDNSKELTSKQFMQKYGNNTMIEKINHAKEKFGFNNKELSEALGYSRQYITKMLNLPQSEKIQAKVVSEIDKYIEWRDKLKSKDLARIGGVDRESFNEIEARLCNEIDMLKFEHAKQLTDLQKKLENKEIVINKLDDQLIRAEKVHNEDVKALNEAHSIIHGQTQEIIELSKILDANRIHIDDLGDSLSSIKAENDKLSYDKQRLSKEYQEIEEGMITEKHKLQSELLKLSSREKIDKTLILIMLIGYFAILLYPVFFK